MPTRSISESEELELRAFVRQCRNMIFGEVYAVFAAARDRGEITQAEIAKKLGKDPATVSRALSAPSNLETDSIAEYLWAAGGAMRFEAFRAGRRLTNDELMADYDERPNNVHRIVPALSNPASPRSTVGSFDVEEPLTEAATTA